ncbi:hypothetical protein NMG60_11027796 [Bertholletia excelsa]
MLPTWHSKAKAKLSFPFSPLYIRGCTIHGPWFSLSPPFSRSSYRTEIMEESGKVPESDGASELLAFLTESDDEFGGDFSPEVPIEEELVEKVMNELRKEINCFQNKDAVMSFPPGSSPAPDPSFLFIGGEKESCGAAFSGLASTVMADVQVAAGGDLGFPAVAGNVMWMLRDGGCCGVDAMGPKMDGCDGREVDDEWLARVLSWGPDELDEWF